MHWSVDSRGIMPTTLIAYKDQQRALAKTRDMCWVKGHILVSCRKGLSFVRLFWKRQELRGRNDCLMSFKQHRDTGNKNQVQSGFKSISTFITDKFRCLSWDYIYVCVDVFECLHDCMNTECQKQQLLAFPVSKKRNMHSGNLQRNTTHLNCELRISYTSSERGLSYC